MDVGIACNVLDGHHIMWLDVLLRKIIRIISNEGLYYICGERI